MAAATMDGMGHHHEPGFLTGSFGKAVVQGTLFAASFAIGGYFGNLLFDPFFFPIIHDPANPVGQALIGFMADTFGWAHELMGVTGDGGLLNTDFVQGYLEPYYPSNAADIIRSYSDEGLGNAGDAFMDDLLQ